MCLFGALFFKLKKNEWSSSWLSWIAVIINIWNLSSKVRIITEVKWYVDHTSSKIYSQSELLDIQALIKHLSELRDYLESASISECFEFSSILLRPLVQYLNESTTPRFKKDDKEHVIRQIIIEIIQKLPHTEVCFQ